MLGRCDDTGKGIYLKLCCHCVDLCHDRCACLAGQSASIKKFHFGVRGGDGTVSFYPALLPHSVSPSLSFSSFYIFAQSLLGFTKQLTNQDQQRVVCAAITQSTVRFQPQGTNFEFN